MAYKYIGKDLRDEYVGKLLIDWFDSYYARSRLNLFSLLWEHYSKFSEEERKKNPKITMKIQEFTDKSELTEEEIEELAIEIACHNYFCINENPQTHALCSVTFKPLFDFWEHKHDADYFTIRFNEEYNKRMLVNATKIPFLFAVQEEILEELGFFNQED